MVLTTPELVAALQNDVRIILHLAGKLSVADLGYRPTAKQRSALELLQYLSFMGPELTRDVLAGRFDEVAWTAAEAAAAARDFDQTLAVIGAQSAEYAAVLGPCPMPTCGRRSRSSAPPVRAVPRWSRGCSTVAPPIVHSCSCISKPAATANWER